MPDETLLRLRRQTTTLADTCAQAPGLWRHDILRDLDHRHIRPHDVASRELFDRLEAHGDSLKEARSLAATVTDGNDTVFDFAHALHSDLSQITRSTAAARDHVALALAGDATAQAADLAVMRIVQEANLIGFGGTVPL